MFSVPTDFYFLGDRTYVHGPTILGAFLRVFEEIGRTDGLPHETRIITCRFRQYARENGEILCWDAAEARPEFNPGRVCATATCSRRGERYHFAFVREGARMIARCLPYDEERYLVRVSPDGRFGGQGSLANLATKKDLIRAIVALNKKVHEVAEAADHVGKSYRWSFASVEELELPGLPAEDPAGGEFWSAGLSLSSTKLWTVEAGLHSLSKGTIHIAGGYSTEFRIGFAGRPKE